MEAVLEDVGVPQHAVLDLDAVDAEGDAAGGGHGGVLDGFGVDAGVDVEAVHAALAGVGDEHGGVVEHREAVEVAGLGDGLDERGFGRGHGEVDLVDALAADDGEEVGRVLADAAEAGGARDLDGGGGGLGHGVDGVQVVAVHVGREDDAVGPHGDVLDRGEPHDLRCGALALREGRRGAREGGEQACAEESLELEHGGGEGRVFPGLAFSGGPGAGMASLTGGGQGILRRRLEDTVPLSRPESGHGAGIKTAWRLYGEILAPAAA